jgi:hypothetical protein
MSNYKISWYESGNQNVECTLKEAINKVKEMALKTNRWGKVLDEKNHEIYCCYYLGYDGFSESWYKWRKKKHCYKQIKIKSYGGEKY